MDLGSIDQSHSFFNSVEHTIAKSLDAGIQTDIIYLIMAKAFDKVPHEKLLYKLEMVGVRGQLLAWFRSYLTNRRHRTVIEGYASDWRYVPSDVPQGSIIGPLLFLIFINDTNIPLYADDAKCFRELLSFDDHAALQKDLYLIEDWSDPWGMSFNASKCKHLNISKRKSLRIHHFSLAIISLRRHSVKKIWELLLTVNCPGTITLLTKSIELVRFCV